MAPTEAWVTKVNVDGAYTAGACQGGVAAVARNAKGELVQAVLEPCPSISALFAKMWAIRLGLKMAKGTHKLVTESNCLVAISIMNKQTQNSWLVRNVALECLSMARRFGEIKFMHVKRDCNFVADWAAAKGG
ncbi:uncharacterized protein [Typha angustifolia]|uniref:uncharacterized protein n=1 Tax=Typha angustifolia TaxID=59011 RepID=UPI003C2C335B